MKIANVLWGVFGIAVAGSYLGENEPKGYHAGNCVTSKISSYDANVINYRNKCNVSINVLVCSNQTATEFFSIFDGKDRTSCQIKSVVAGGYIDNFYGADENSSFFRKAISTSDIRIGACMPPVRPRFTSDGKVICTPPSS